MNKRVWTTRKVGKKLFRKCTICKIEKSIDNFYKDSGKTLGYGYKCKPCHDKEWRKRQAVRMADPEDHAYLMRNRYFYTLKMKYGVTRDQFEDMIKKQDNRCAICLKILKKFVIDHNHETGKVRGILCWSCNTLLGMAGDDIAILKRSVKYLNP